MEKCWLAIKASKPSWQQLPDCLYDLSGHNAAMVVYLTREDSYQMVSNVDFFVIDFIQTKLLLEVRSPFPAECAKFMQQRLGDFQSEH